MNLKLKIILKILKFNNKLNNINYKIFKFLIKNNKILFLNKLILIIFIKINNLLKYYNINYKFYINYYKLF